jgi:acetyl-CoA carboxylase carboxyl transferase subunit alpha
VPEPLGGAHRDPAETGKNLKEAILAALHELEKIPVDKLVQRRYNKFRQMGRFQE